MSVINISVLENEYIGQLANKIRDTLVEQHPDDILHPYMIEALKLVFIRVVASCVLQGSVEDLAKDPEMLKHFMGTLGTDVVEEIERLRTYDAARRN